MELNLNLGSLDSGKIKEIDQNTIYDTVIIGGGPAAISAAIYAVRKGLNTALVTLKIGGQILDTKEIENYIGVISDSGEGLKDKMYNHLKEYPIAVEKGTSVKSLSLDGNEKVITTTNGKTIKGKTVILSTGANHRELNVPGESDYKGKGMAYCTTCDAPFYKDLKVAVVGGGNSGVEGALELSNIATHVTLIEFTDRLNAEQVLIDKLKAANNVDILTGSAVKKVYGEDLLTGLNYEDRATGEVKDLSVDGIFVEIGFTANSELAQEIGVETNKFGEILIDSKCKTNVDGVFAAGDCTNVPYKQVIVACGEGAKAALTAFEYVMKL